MSRSRRSDGDLTKSKIIEAAGPLIAQYGFAKTANKTIANAANVDLAAINYHFDGRDGLYQAVLVEAHAHYLDEKYLLELVESTQSPEEKLSLLLETLLHKLTEKEVWYGKVFIRELFSPSEHLLNFIEFAGMRKFFLIRKLISQVAGLDENDPAVLPCILSVMTPCMMLIIAGPNAQAPEPLKNIAQMPLHDLVEHFKKFSLAGLKAISQANLKN